MGDQDTVGIKENEEEVFVPAATTWPLELTWKDNMGHSLNLTINTFGWFLLISNRKAL